MTNLQQQVVDTSFTKSLGHIPSALSMVEYWNVVNRTIDYDIDCLVVGKPYGSLAYHISWGDSKTDPIVNGQKNVFWSDPTLGNCLGVAVGAAFSGNFRRIYVNIGDGCLQEGTILEAMALIGSRKYQNLDSIILCIDCNGIQCTGKTYWNPENVSMLAKSMGWWSSVIEKPFKYDRILEILQIDGPKCLVFHTTKGDGVDFMVDDPISWHYRTLDVVNYERCH